MSTVTQQVEYPDVSEESIADYLKSHPDFFERNLTLLSGLRLPHRTTGGAISLVERQVDVLRQRNTGDGNQAQGAGAGRAQQ